MPTSRSPRPLFLVVLSLLMAAGPAAACSQVCSRAARGQPTLRQRLPDVGLDNLAHMLGLEARIEMLGRDHDLS